ncbi:Vacuolar protein sorting-associated protein 62 [Lecanora helva]
MHTERRPEALEKGMRSGAVDLVRRSPNDGEQCSKAGYTEGPYHYVKSWAERTSSKWTRRKRLLISTCLLAFAILNFWISGVSFLCGRHQNCKSFFENAVYGDVLDDFSDIVTQPEHISNDSRILGKIPGYVLDYAPLVHLYSEEQFWPCDIAEHLSHTTPDLDYTPIQHISQSPNLTTLNRLNDYGNARHVYLTSNDNVEERPEWLGGQKNIPDEFGDDDIKTNSARFSIRRKLSEQTHGGRSDAPAVLITVDKGHGVVDAFWFFFYSYNLGNLVFNVRFGNHVGDWEHTLIRFHHGKPKLVFLSEHNFGAAYTYKAMEKIGKRPVVYSATGTHAMYATPGSQPYILPLGLLHDETDRGPLWDPTLNSHTYSYSPQHDTLHASHLTPSAPIEWFYYAGKWGDKFYPLDDDRQYGFLGEYHYVSGPLGPRFKNLGRRKVCQGRYTDPCVIRDEIGMDGVRVWPGLGDGEDDGEIGFNDGDMS